MKSPNRRIRRRRATNDTNVFRQEAAKDAPFFSADTSHSFFQPTQHVQRKCDTCEAEDKQLQRAEDKKEEEIPVQRAEDKKEEEIPIQRAEDKKEEEVPIQRAPAEKEEEKDKMVQKKEGGDTAPGNSVSSYISNLGGKGESLPASANQFFSARMGYDFSNVKLHTDRSANDSARDVNARAYTIDNHIVFSGGGYQPDTQEGKKLLAHELTHVVQQGQAPLTNTLQPLMDDGHDLQSTALKGDIRLEACYDGDTGAYLYNGSRGGAVSRVQYALTELGYLLPVYGVDGIFGNETAATVRQFQADNGLAADAIVGKLTIGVLDALHANAHPPVDPPVPPLPPIDPPGPATCEMPPDNDPTVFAKRQPQAPRPVKQPVIARTVSRKIQRKHLSIQEAIDGFSEKVNSSKSSDPMATSFGQFYWSHIIKDMILKDVLKVFTFMDPERGMFVNLLDAIGNGDLKEVAEITANLTKKLQSGSSAAQQLLNLFKTPSQTTSATTLWGEFNKQDQVPADIDKYKNIHVYSKIRNEERTLCWSVAQFMITRFNKKKGFTDNPQAGKKPVFSASLMASARRFFEWKDNDSRINGDIVSYDKSLADKVDRIKEMLDKGFLLHARVVSGVNTGTGLAKEIDNAKGKSPVPPDRSIQVSDEHSLVIIGFDNDEFVFWDPDSSVSSSPRAGFGKLFFAGGRFTTAKDDNDLFVNDEGMHDSGNKRYQVLFLSVQ